jgi:hypothetical protein
MRYRLRTLFGLSAIAGLVLAFVVLPILDYKRQLYKLQELAATKHGHVRVINGQAVAIEFTNSPITEADLKQINWRLFRLKLVLLYNCPNVSDTAIDTMRLDGMGTLLYVDTTGSGVTSRRLTELYDHRQCIVSNGQMALAHPRVTTAMLNDF